MSLDVVGAAVASLLVPTAEGVAFAVPEVVAVAGSPFESIAPVLAALAVAEKSLLVLVAILATPELGSAVVAVALHASFASAEILPCHYRYYCYY